MPNWCFNTTIIYGEEKEIERLRKILEDAFSKEPKNMKKIKNDWNQNWIANMFLATGYIYDEKKGCFVDRDIKARGGVENLNLNFEKDAIEIQYETAWDPIYSSIDKMLEENFEGLYQVTCSEEPGIGIYINTDVEGLYFSDNYILDYCINEEYNDNRYFVEEKSLVSVFNKAFNTNFSSYKEIKIKEREIFDKYSENDDSFFLTVEAFQKK